MFFNPSGQNRGAASSDVNPSQEFDFSDIVSLTVTSKQELMECSPVFNSTREHHQSGAARPGKDTDHDE